MEKEKRSLNLVKVEERVGGQSDYTLLKTLALLKRNLMLCTGVPTENSGTPAPQCHLGKCFLSAHQEQQL